MGVEPNNHPILSDVLSSPRVDGGIGIYSGVVVEEMLHALHEHAHTVTFFIARGMMLKGLSL